MSQQTVNRVILDTDLAEYHKKDGSNVKQTIDWKDDYGLIDQDAAWQEKQPVYGTS